MDATDKQETWPDGDRVVFVPDEDIRTLESICDEIQQVRDELRKVAKALTVKKGKTIKTI